MELCCDRSYSLLRCGLVVSAALLFGLLLLLLHRKERARNDKERCAFHLLAFQPGDDHV